MLRPSESKNRLGDSSTLRIPGALLVAATCLIGTAALAAVDSPLHRALKERDYDDAIRLLRSRVNANVAGADGELPLVIAADDSSADAVDVVRELLRYGTRADATHRDGDSALLRAAHHGNLAVVELLVQHGADVNASRTRDSVAGKRVDTPLSVAYANGHFRVGEFLESLGDRTPEGKDIKAYRDLGRIEKRIDALLKQRPPGSIDVDEWGDAAFDAAFAEVKPELARWFKEVERSNPEAMEMLNAVAEEAPPPGMDELEWAKRKHARILQMIQSGALTIKMPGPPPLD